MNKAKIIICLTLCGSLGLFAQTPEVKTINAGGLIIGDNTDVVTGFHFLNTKSGTLINDGKLHLYDHFTNQDGKVDFSSNTSGLTHFIGGKKQRIVAGITQPNYHTYFNNVSFDNQSGEVIAYDLLGEASVSGEAYFGQGIINNKTADTKGNLIFMGDNAYDTNVSDQSYVNGRVERMADADAQLLKFPIGTGVLKTESVYDGLQNLISLGETAEKQHYRYAKIALPQSESRLVEAEYFYNTSGMDRNATNGTVEMVNATEVWYIDGGGKEMVLSLPWNEATTDERLLSNTKDLVIVRWDETNKQWMQVGGVVDATEMEVTSPVSNQAPIDSKPMDSDITKGYFTLAKKYVGDTDLEIYNGISPNDDGLNDQFEVSLKNGGRFESLKVRIYNRWGALVFESNDYGNGPENIFMGYANTKLVVNDSHRLPTGTYYYVLDYTIKDNKLLTKSGTKTGFIYISDDGLSL